MTSLAFQSDFDNHVVRTRKMISKWVLNRRPCYLGIQQRSGFLGLELHALVVLPSVDSTLILVFALYASDF